MSGHAAATIALAAVVGLLLGSIPFGVIVLRAAGRPDPRTIGSGNIGATNVTRAGGRGLGALTLALDAGKGLLAVGLFGPTVAAAAAGAGAILGHCFTPWLRFRGGKGVATFLGVSLVGGSFMPLVFLLSWLTAWVATRISAVGGVAACALTALAACLSAWVAPEPRLVAGAGALVLGAIVVGVRHRSNFQKILEDRRVRRAEGMQP